MTTAIREIFASYSELGGNAPLIQILDGRAGFDLAQKGAKIMGHTVTILNNDSTREDDPILTILCITHEQFSRQVAEEISQDVINWLMDNGHMKKRLAAKK
jgi:hypothetical protein